MPAPSKKKSNVGKNNMNSALGRRHGYRLAAEFISDLLKARERDEQEWW